MSPPLLGHTLLDLSSCFFLCYHVRHRHPNLFTCTTRNKPLFILKLCLFFFSFLFCFLGLYPRHMEVLRLGVQLELLLPACTTATVTSYPSRICDLHHSSRQRWILDPLSEARDQTRVLMDTSQVHYHCTTVGTPLIFGF